MSLRKFLILPLLVSVGIFIYFSRDIYNSLLILFGQVHITIYFVVILVFAVSFQICGHIVRSKKAEILFSPVKPNTTRFQFRALSIGYLFDALLPLRLGELVRARVIAGAFELSFGLTIALIAFERFIDALIIGLLGLSTLLLLGVVNIALVWSIGLIVIAIIGIGLVAFIASGNKRLLRFVHSTTSIFKPGLKDNIRFKVWSLIYGLRQTLVKKQLKQYLYLTLLSWAFYLLSVCVLVVGLFPGSPIIKKLAMTVAPYFGLAIPAGPASLGVFSHASNSIISSTQMSSSQLIGFDLLAWLVLIIPMSIIGLALLATKTRETLWRKTLHQVSLSSLENKLLRTEDISHEMASFLDNFFSGNSLSHIVHKLELQPNFRLIKYFKGGSDAITILASQDKKKIVKKIIPLEFEDRLSAQHDWLVRYQGAHGIVNVLREDKHPNYYSIDLEYRPEDIMFFEFMHKNRLSYSKKVLDDVWAIIYKNVYGKRLGKTVTTHNRKRTDYINKHILGCLEKAGAVDAELLRAMDSPTLIINGEEYDNILQVLEKIKKHPAAWNDIATYKESALVHGDVAVDNILVSKIDRSPLIIDPAPDGNIINGPVFDFGKNMQSLYCGYEFLLRDDDPVYLTDNNVINYNQYKSAQFDYLCDYVRQTLAPKYLSKSEQNAMLFHAGALLIRRLKHQVYFNPSNTLKFYAEGVKTLNDFLAQYGSTKI